MALLYFPKDSNVALRNAWDPSYQELILSCNPNMVFYFDTGSALNPASSSMLFITSSWALTASITILLTSSSYADTAAFALNAAGGTSVSSASVYTTIVTSSTNWITASFAYPEQYVSIVSGALYNFTCSGNPPANTSSNVSLFLNNTSTATSSLTFPSSWIFIGIVPTYLTASKSAILSLKALGNQVIAAWGAQY